MVILKVSGVRFQVSAFDLEGQPICLEFLGMKAVAEGFQASV
jgi:hypothetical protein